MNPNLRLSPRALALYRKLRANPVSRLTGFAARTPSRGSPASPREPRLEAHRLRRANPVSRLTGFAARSAIDDARTVAEFEELESAGLVRMASEPEHKDYFDVYGRVGSERDQKSLEDYLSRWGCYYVSSEYFDGEEWQQADGVGLCVYENPESPFENCYVVQMMREAITQAHKVAAEPAERLHWEQRDTVTRPGRTFALSTY